ncbi:MAG: NAD-dependent epimerase/dehydratase family protein [Anaerolineae bacterium]|nr:NAD-dependent epimerase/dehydratase family protein [Anaerolineae bacterium]
MRALVTGGGGFLGRAIVEQLVARGDEVASFSRHAHPELESLGVRTIQGDIQDRAALTTACAGVEALYHVAARWGEWGPWEPFYAVNVVGAENAIAACRAQGVPRLVYTSSPSVVFDYRPQAGCDESLPYPERYKSHYAHTKAIAEQRVLAANGADGLLTVALRPHLVFGPRDEQLIPAILERGGKGIIPQIGPGDNLVDLTYVEDAARAHLLAADALRPGSPAAGSAYFITQGEPVVAWTWINELLARFDLGPVRGRVPLWAALAACALFEVAYRVLPLRGQPPLTRLLAYELAYSHYYDISRARRDLGYAPQYTMDQALERTVAYFLSSPRFGV